MNKPERTLAALLRLLAAAHVCALFGVFMPARWMAAGHAWLGLGGFPDSPLAPYLARSVSALYALYGALLWICATDVRRYAPIVRYYAVTGFGFAALVTLLDLQLGMPWYWTFGEGPMLVAVCVALLALLRRVPRL